jgi:hypothetical protein
MTKDGWCFQDRVARALLPVLRHPLRGNKHRQECRCHKSLVIPVSNFLPPALTFMIDSSDFSYPQQECGHCWEA